MPSIYLNIGSNRGNSPLLIQEALKSLKNAWPRARLRQAPMTVSQPWGYDSPHKFFNLGIALDFATTLPDPLDVLHTIQDIEKYIAPGESHRNSDGTYRDRRIDIDIIAMDGITMDSPALTLPHPRAHARPFVMQPMAFLAPHWKPGNAATLLHAKKTTSEIKRDTLEEFRNKAKTPLVAVADNIRSGLNTGSLLRTADAFALECVYLCGITPPPSAPEVHKTALGAEESVLCRHSPSTLDTVNQLKQQGYTVCCLEQVHDSIPLNTFKVDRTKKYAIVAGNEITGVDQQVIDACDIHLEIPQSGTKHSLNVTVSTAIALWHFYKESIKENP